MTHYTNRTKLTFTEPSIPKELLIYSSRAHKIFSRIEHILGHKDSLNKYKRVEIIPTIFSDHNALKLEINCKKKAGRNTNTYRLNNMLLKNN